MADDIEEPDLVETPEINAGRALGVSVRGNAVPRGQDIKPSTGVLRAIDPMAPAQKAVVPVKTGGRELVDPNSMATSATLRRTPPGEYDNTAARERWQAKRPFTSDRQMPEYMRPEHDAPTDRQLAEMRHQEVEQRRQAAAAAKQEREQAKLATDADNASLEANFRGAGKQFYTDPLTKRLTPIVDSATGKELYHATDWEKGMRPDGKTPAMVKRNKFGETEYKDPKIVHNPDLTDDQLYYEMGDEQVPAGKIDDLINHPDFGIAKQARTARRLRTAAMWKEASAGVQEEADMATASLKTAQEEDLALQDQMVTLSAQLNSLESNPAIKATEGGFLGFGGHPAPAAQPLLAMKQQLQAKVDQIGARQAELANMTGPGGQLAREAKMKTLSLGIVKAKAKHIEYSQMAEDRREILRREGIPEASDPNLQSILRAQAVYGSEAQKQTGSFQKEFRGESSNVARPAVQDAPEDQPPATSGAPASGGDEFAKHYGDGSGSARPDDVLKLYKRSKELTETLNNPDTSINDVLRDRFSREQQYVESLAQKRFAKLPADQQKRVTEVTRDPTWWDALKGAGKSLAEEATVGAGAVMKGLAQVSEKLGPLANPETGEINQEQEQLFRDRQNETALQKMQRVKGSAEFQIGSMLQDAAKETFAKNQHEDEGAISQAINAAAGAAGGFAPLVGSGPLAPVTIGLQTAGEDMQRIYDEQIQKGATPERAAEFAQKRALLSGAVQSALFEVLPKPLHKAGNKLIVDKIAGSALKKFFANRVAQATEGAALGAASAAAGNATSGRDLGQGIGESATGLALAQAVMPRGESPNQKPKGTPPESGPAKAPAPPEPPAPKTPVDAPLDGPKSAAESADVFEPALKERANTPPPGKSAAESAAVFDDVATTEEASGKVGSQQEAKAQKLVDEVAAATGRPREEILATREGRTTPEWTKDLEYQRDPIGVDPDRRIAELKSDIEKSDADWAQHREQLSSDVERTRADEAWANRNREAGQQRAADAAGTTERRQQRAGDVEAALSEAERVRRSPKSAEGLRKDLTAQSQPTTREAQLLARRAAIEGELVKAERTRQSNRGGADLKNDLADRSGKPPSDEPPAGPGATAPVKPVDIGPRDASVSTGTGVETAKESKMMEDWRRQNVADAAEKDPIGGVSKMSGKEFHNWVHGLQDSGLTEKAHDLGISAIGKPERIAEIKAARDAVDVEFKKSMEDYKTAPEDKKMGILEALTPLTSKRQYFNEAASAAENIEGAAGDQKVKAAHEKFPRGGEQLAREIMAKNPNADEGAARQILGKQQFEVRDVPLSEVGELFGEKTVQPDVVEKYTAEKSNDPIVLSRVPGEQGGQLRVVDGKHRFTAAKNRGDETIRAWAPVEAEKSKTLGDQPVKLEVRRDATGEMIEIEMSATKAAKRITDHMSTLAKVLDCLKGAA